MGCFATDLTLSSDYNPEHRKAELLEIKQDCDYLIELSGCSTEQALLALMRNGKISGTFKDSEIKELLGINTTVLGNIDHKVTYVLRQAFKGNRLEDVKDYLGTK